MGGSRELGLRPGGFVEVEKFRDLTASIRRSLYKRSSFDLLAVRAV